MNLPNNQAAAPKRTGLDPSGKVVGFVGTIELMGFDGLVARSWKVRQPVCTIGCGGESNIQIDGEGVAGLHLSLSFGRRHVSAKSSSGFWVSGRAVREWLFDSATELQLGSRTIRITPARALTSTSTPLPSNASPLQARQQSDSIPIPTRDSQTSSHQSNLNDRAQTLSIVSESVSAILPSVERVVQDLVGPLKGAMEEIRSSVQEVVERSQHPREILDRPELLASQEMLKQLEANLADRIEGRFESLLSEIERIREESLTASSSTFSSLPSDPKPNENTSSESSPSTGVAFDELPQTYVDPLLLQELESTQQRLGDFELQVQRLREERDLAQSRAVDLSTELVQISQSAQNDQRMAQSVSDEHQRLIEHLSSLDDELIQVQRAAQQDSARWESSASELQRELIYWQEKALQLQDEAERAVSDSANQLETSADYSLEQSVPTHSDPNDYEANQEDYQSTSESEYSPFEAYDQQPKFDVDELSNESSHSVSSDNQSEHLEPNAWGSTQDEVDSRDPFEQLANDRVPVVDDLPLEDEPFYDTRFAPLDHAGIASHGVDPFDDFADRNELHEPSDMEAGESLFDHYRNDAIEASDELPERDYPRHPAKRNEEDAERSFSISDSIIASLEEEQEDVDRVDRGAVGSEIDDLDREEHPSVRRVRESESVLREEKYEPQPLEDLHFAPAASSDVRKKVESEEDEDSIEAYMKQLLERVRGTESEFGSTPSATSKATVRQTKNSTGPARTRITEEARSPQTKVETRSNVGNTGGDPNPVESEDPDNSIPFDPSSYTPRQQAPERGQNMAAMRDLANVTARRAIEKSDRRRLATQGLFKLSVAAIGLAGALFLLMINGFRVNMALVGTVAGLCIAGLWGFESIASLSNLAKIPVRKEGPGNEPQGEGNPLVRKSVQQ